MADINYLPIDKNKIPEQFEIIISNVLLKFVVRYNAAADFFTADIYDKDDAVIAYGKRFIIDVDLFENIIDSRLPNVQIIPYDPSNTVSRITYDNFMGSVKPYIFEVTP
jgi:hypothetical protein